MAGAGRCELLTVTGRTTGRPRPAPSGPVRYRGQRWLAAPYGPVSWVKHDRAAGLVTLSRGRAGDQPHLLGGAQATVVP